MKKLAIALTTLISMLTGCSSEYSTSIGIIGGADGPTSVFIAGKTNWFEIAGSIAIVIILIAAIIYFVKKKK